MSNGDFSHVYIVMHEYFDTSRNKKMPKWAFKMNN